MVAAISFRSRSGNSVGHWFVKHPDDDKTTFPVNLFESTLTLDHPIYVRNARPDVALSDVLLIEAEKIGGIASFRRAIAVTLEQGRLAGLQPGEDPLKIEGLTAANIAFAVKLAGGKGWAIDPRFAL
jgi:hypothetical protein